MPILNIFRGLPGSGKTTDANKTGTLVISPSDMYSMRNGKYQWCKEYEDQCQDWSIEILEFCIMHEIDVSIAEVLPTIESVKFYTELAEEKGYTVKVYDLKISVEESLKRNTHNVPIEHIQAMAESWEDWKEEQE